VPCCPACTESEGGSASDGVDQKWCRYPNMMRQDIRLAQARLNRITHAWFAMKKVRRPIKKDVTDGCPKKFAVSPLLWADENTCYSVNDGIFPVQVGTVYWGWKYSNKIQTTTTTAADGITTEAQIRRNLGNADGISAEDWDVVYWKQDEIYKTSASRPTYDYHSKTENRYYIEMKRLYLAAVYSHESVYPVHASISASSFSKLWAEAEYPTTGTAAWKLAAKNFDASEVVESDGMNKMGCVGLMHFVKPDCPVSSITANLGSWVATVGPCGQMHYRYLQARIHCLMRMLNNVARTDSGCHQGSKDALDDHSQERYNCLCRRRIKYNLVANPKPANFGFAQVGCQAASEVLCQASQNLVCGCESEVLTAAEGTYIPDTTDSDLVHVDTSR
jgi:hypothetical protein